MLGLGSSIAKPIYQGSDFLPSSIPSSQAWWRFQTGLETVSGERDYTQFGDLETLLSWDDQIGSNHCKNDDNWQRPQWHLLSTSVNYRGIRHWDLTSNIVITDDFTWSFRFLLKGIANEGFLGQNNSNYLEITDANTFTADIGGTTPDNVFTEASKAIEVDIWYTLHIVRESGSLKLYIDGGAHDNIQWGATLTDSDTFTVTGIGSWGDASQEFNGRMKDVSYFNKALSDSERANMNTYLASL